MATETKMMYCKACKKPTMHLRKGTSHLLHLVLSLITMGGWVIVWLFVAISNSMHSQCTVCGRTENWRMD